MYKTLAFLCLFLVLTGCKRPVKQNRAVYFWKTTYDLSVADRSFLTHAGIKKIYLRLFDIDYHPETKTIRGVASIIFQKAPFSDFEYVPVVYITNKTFANTSIEKVDSLAVHTLKKIDVICKKAALRYHEIQIDCDWTGSTKEKYFQFLGAIKTRIHKKDIILSATIRLHQIKYAAVTGIPAVDRGMLMFYNLGDLKNASGKNSIFNASDAQRYTDYIKFYPLPMDLVLPAFSWGIQLRRGKIVRLLSNFTEADKRPKEFVKQANYLYKVQKPIFYKGYYFMEGDEIKLEVITPEIAREAARLVCPFFKDNTATIALYHYNALKSNSYEKHDIKKVFSCFH